VKIRSRRIHELTEVGTAVFAGVHWGRVHLSGHWGRPGLGASRFLQREAGPQCIQALTMKTDNGQQVDRVMAHLIPRICRC
jgi:hypothetical protein